MKFLFYLFAFISFGLLTNSCNNCRLVECAGRTGIIEIRLMRNGQNAVFGPSAFLDRDSIRYFITEPLERDFIIGYPESTQTISLFMDEGNEHILQISNIRTDTFVSYMELTGMGECCPMYEFTSVTRNGQIICNLNCQEIIEIEI